MLIAISGKIGSGKDYTANKIIEHFPEMNFKTLAFGLNVKKCISILTGIPMDFILTRKGKQFYVEQFKMTIGEMCQKFATDTVRNNFNENTWIYSLQNTNNMDDNIIIMDCRFYNELKYIKDNGGLIIRLSGDPKQANKHDKRDKFCKSETELDNCNLFDFYFNSEIDDIQLLINFLKEKI